MLFLPSRFCLFSRFLTCLLNPAPTVSLWDLIPVKSISGLFCQACCSCFWKHNYRNCTKHITSISHTGEESFPWNYILKWHFFYSYISFCISEDYSQVRAAESVLFRKVSVFRSSSVRKQCCICRITWRWGGWKTMHNVWYWLKTRVYVLSPANCKRWLALTMVRITKLTKYFICLTLINVLKNNLFCVLARGRVEPVTRWFISCHLEIEITTNYKSNG